jgi:hypothetical protein
MHNPNPTTICSTSAGLANHRFLKGIYGESKYAKGHLELKLFVQIRLLSDLLPTHVGSIDESNGRSDKCNGVLLHNQHRYLSKR